MSYITKTEFARKHGFSRQYVSELLRKGILQEEGGLLNEENADYALSLKNEMRASSKKQTTELQGLFFKAKLQNEIEKGKLLKLETAEKEKSLISTDMVKDTLFRKGRVVRDAMLNIPDRVSSVLSAMNDPREIHELLTKEIRLALEELSSDG